MNNVLGALLSIILAFSVSQRTLAQGCNHVVQGIVKESDTKRGIPFAEVFLVETGRGAVTDSSGRYIIKNICNGTYTLRVQHIECLHQSQKISISGEGAIVDFELHHDSIMLGSITVTASVIEAQSPQSHRTIGEEDLEKTRGSGLAETLKSLPGVQMLNTGATVAKPMIQGMHSNRVLIFNSGVRLEGQQWGLDHAPETDASNAGKITVLKGAGSVQYGSDAIGGIVIVEPRPMPQTGGIKGEFSAAGFSNGKSAFSQLFLEDCPSCAKKTKFSWRGTASIKRGGNLHTPAYYLANTGLRELNFSTTLQLKKNRFNQELYLSRMSSKTGIFRGSHIGNLTDLNTAISEAEPAIKADFTYNIDRPMQVVNHHVVKWRGDLQTGERHKLSTQFSVQNNYRGEFDAHRLFGSLPKNLDNPSLEFKLWSAEISTIFEHQLREDIHGKAGFSYNYQNNVTSRGGLIPNYVGMNTGLFLLERWHRHNSKFEVEAALRVDHKWMNAAIRQSGTDEIGKLKQFNFRSIAGQLGTTFQWTEQLNLSLNVGTSWRPPAPNELFSLGVHHGTASFERGNVNLKTERALSNTLSLKYEGILIRAQLDGYINFISDFIYLKPDSVPVQTIRGAFPSFAFTQTNARIYGFDWSTSGNLHANLSLESKGAVLYGFNTNDREWLIFMPSNRLQSGITYAMPQMGTFKKNYLSVHHIFVARQDRVPPNQDFLPPPPSYHLAELSFGTSIPIKKYVLSLGCNLKNLGNTRYREYLNRFRYFTDEVGSDVQLRVKLSF